MYQVYLVCEYIDTLMEGNYQKIAAQDLYLVPYLVSTLKISVHGHVLVC